MRDGCVLYDYDLHQVAANPALLRTADYRSNSAYRFFDAQCHLCQRRVAAGDQTVNGPCYDMVCFDADGGGAIRRVMHRGGRNPLLRRVWKRAMFAPSDV